RGGREEAGSGTAYTAWIAVCLGQVGVVSVSFPGRTVRFQAPEDCVAWRVREVGLFGGQRIGFLGSPGREPGEGEVAKTHGSALQNFSSREPERIRSHGHSPVSGRETSVFPPSPLGGEGRSGSAMTEFRAGKKLLAQC